MRAAAILFAIVGFNLPEAHSATVCGGPLTNAQVDGLEKLFSPAYGPSLSNVGTGSAAGVDMSKKLKKADIAALAANPRIAAKATLDAVGADLVRNMLNANAQASIPGWLASAIGIPNAWLGLGADAAIQLVNGSGDAGRLKLANLAGRVGPGGKLSVIEAVANDKTGAPKFIYHYTHTTAMDGKEVQSLLRSCRADIVEVS